MEKQPAGFQRCTSTQMLLLLLLLLLHADVRGRV
jgi:hypothetical protein